MPTMPKSAEGFKFILVTVFMAIRTKLIVCSPIAIQLNRARSGSRDRSEHFEMYIHAAFLGADRQDIRDFENLMK